jgi:hypothetical protein
VIFQFVIVAVGHFLVGRCYCLSFSCWSLLLLVIAPVCDFPVGHGSCWSLFLLVISLLVIVPVGHCSCWPLLLLVIVPVGHLPIGRCCLVMFL